MTPRAFRRLALPAILLAFAGVVVAILWQARTDVLRPGEVAGVPLVPPEGWEVVRIGAAQPRDAAARLLALLREKPALRRGGVMYERGADRLLLLVDLDLDRLDERVASGSGTMVETSRAGAALRRLESAASGGSADLAGLPAPEKKNLYH